MEANLFILQLIVQYQILFQLYYTITKDKLIFNHK